MQRLLSVGEGHTVSEALSISLRIAALGIYVGAHAVKLEVEYGKMDHVNPPLLSPLISTMLVTAVFVLTWFYRKKK